VGGFFRKRQRPLGDLPTQERNVALFQFESVALFCNKDADFDNALGQLHFVEHVICKRRPLLQAIDVGKPSEVLIEALRRPVEEQGYGT